MADRLLAAAISNANMALRTAVTINGGAAVALLAFVGALATRTDIEAENLIDMASTLTIFAWGVATAVSGMILAYLTNGTAAESLRQHKRNWTLPYVTETPASTKHGRWANWFQGFGIGAALFSLGLFIYGMFAISDAAIQLVTDAS
jgi:hypothetical protein